MNTERTSGRVRKATQRFEEIKANSYAVTAALSKRKLKGSSNDSTKDNKVRKGADPNAIIYHIPQPKPVDENKFIPTSVALSLLDKAAQISVSTDQMTCTGADGGFRMIRATHGVHFGPYYWECEILPSSNDSPWTPHVRVGWSTRFGELNGPVGYDKHSFGYRDISGSKIHRRMRQDDYGEEYGVGDVIGCLIDLGPKESLNEIRFFKNGKDQGQAYGYQVGSIIPKGVYFPAISLYGKAKVRVNFGPSFIEPIDNTKFNYNSYSDVQPMNAREIAEHEKRIASIRQLRMQSLDNEIVDCCDTTRCDVGEVRSL